MNKIIVPTDFSATAADSLRYANFLAQVTGFSIEVLHVHDGYGHTESSRIRKGDKKASQNALNLVDTFIHSTLKETQASSSAETAEAVDISSREVMGSPTDVLIDISGETTTRLIVMGGVGSGVISTVTPFFGSVARTVAEKSKCPVLLVPKEYGNPEMNRVSIAFDVLEGLKETSTKFDFLRIPFAPEMRLVHVRDSNEKVEARKEVELLKEVDKTGFPGYKVELDLLSPRFTAHSLMDYSTDKNIDLLVVGHRKRSFIKRLFSDSEVTPVLHHGITPVLVIPISEY